MRRWLGLPLAVLLMAGLLPSAWANEEMHPGGRLFYPLWDVSTANRLTFIIVTREALNEGQAIVTSVTAGTSQVRFRTRGTGNCIPRGTGGSRTNVNRSDLGGTSGSPVFVDDVHFEYYGKSCISVDETVHMSCADIDLFLLAASNNPTNKPRSVFVGVADEGRGALDVHLVTNGSVDPKQRKNENSLMGHAIISDLAEGWAATYPAAAAKSTFCFFCQFLDSGTAVGYENYPMEVFLPFALTDPFPTQGGLLRNVLSLWGPGLLPGANLNNTTINIDWRWWDGRERVFFNSVNDHSLIRPLGGAAIAGLDQPIDPARFNVANFICGHDSTGNKAENDGFPRTGTSATACGAPDVPDPTHKSDNFESSPDFNNPGHSIQTSTPIGWWRFKLRRDQEPPTFFSGSPHSGRGLVGVVLSSTPGAVAIGVGDATRLWHKDPCKLSQSADTYGPPHVDQASLFRNSLRGDIVSLFNIFSVSDQGYICRGGFFFSDNVDGF